MSTSTRAPGLANRYCLPVNGLTTVNAVFPMYSNTVLAGMARTGAGGFETACLLLPQHMFILRFFHVETARDPLAPGADALDQNRRP